MVIEARYVLIVGAGESLLGLDHFNTVSYSRAEAILRPSKALIGKLDILPGDFNLFFRGIQIEKSGANVLVNLPADVFRFGLSLTQFCFGLRDITFNPSAGEERNSDPRLKREISVRVAKSWPNIAVATVNRHSRIAFAFGSGKGLRGSFLGIESGTEIAARFGRNLQRIVDVYRSDVQIWECVGQLKLLP